MEIIIDVAAVILIYILGMLRGYNTREKYEKGLDK